MSRTERQGKNVYGLDGRMEYRVIGGDRNIAECVGKHPNGRDAFRYTIVDGQLSGVSMSWHDDGSIASEENYAEGEKNGVCTLWHRGNIPSFSGNYVNGALSGKAKWFYSNGQISRECCFTNGRMHGTNVEWFSTGGIRYRSGYVDGRKHGEEEEWDENGYLISSTWHLRGVKVSKKMVRALESGAMTAGMIASIKNAEVRRVCLEEFGYARFLAEVEHEIVDMDGDQELVRVSWHVREEDLWLVKVKCPSTGAFYTLRVPPGMKTVKQAVAWTFGGPENRYKPEAET